ncbi:MULTISPECIES: hypothetical protein [Pedobacter]|nr:MULTISPECIES: hypothetical protein [Pedobacter]MBB5438018.1 hypothetical protein [Pedobacter sp. AK017]MBB5440255.1 hypothetical protein [Pedobacter sp. AK017]
MKDNLGSLVLKYGDVSARIDRMCAALQFAGRMKQLIMAIDTGASQDCAYRLTNLKGLEWILNCRVVKGMVALELWLEKLGCNERLVVPFDWRGSVEEFRNAINRMIDRMPAYQFYR